MEHAAGLSWKQLPSSDRFNLKISFGNKGNGALATRAGWSTPEPTETWSNARVSVLEIPTPPSPHDLLLSIRFRPHVEVGRLPVQRFTVAVNGTSLARFTASRPTVRAIPIPAKLLAGRSAIIVELELPDAIAPREVSANQDSRTLGIALEAMSLSSSPFSLPDGAADVEEALNGVDVEKLALADRMPLKDLMLHFESLGQNCEFGLVQRRLGAEPLGLLRFSSTPLPKLLNALEAGFEGMGAPENTSVEIAASGREYMVSDAKFGFLYHAFVEVGAMEPDAIRARELRRAPFLIRKLLEELEAGEKIFVFKGMGAMDEEEVYPLVAALQRYGPNTLLFVNLAAAKHAAGTVETRTPGFQVGYLERFAPSENAHDFDLTQWVSICRKSYQLKIAGI